MPLIGIYPIHLNTVKQKAQGVNLGLLIFVVVSQLKTVFTSAAYLLPLYHHRSFAFCSRAYMKYTLSLLIFK